MINSPYILLLFHLVHKICYVKPKPGQVKFFPKSTVNFAELTFSLHFKRCFLRFKIYGHTLKKIMNINWITYIIMLILGLILETPGLRPATLLKKRLWHRFFPMNFAKLLRTPFLYNTSARLLLKVVSQ